ncbi:NAD(P)-dependent dehydrogenase (short-subunit alcohol dehydrogenase family) [Actinomadura hallensis]|uniref:NAD(P)-dependent dehydrogenase (Short-subunit alcohol dehydrogenase family) n=1 Tax=Actinomadura hallensis TaxID=337895 RepID=A0A543IBZ8_9ACTN|nr:SDR family NAD(P)-dependent oxidoreductase [Actinomadura hallensis]TQM68116.1 NAD(P)-dependent dehydrogenase (short-subunit alcohol dehydrogenase family) [Actinomadura hallensis]HLV75907.1 SDR family NAD(P)-dependent oxidoreductase [Vulgatibacteraceae bacterium]
MGLTEDRVAVVTGASRGAGKGIALALGETGATVYVTGRTRAAGEADLPGTVHETAAEIDKRGGTGIPVICDHSRDEQVEALFAQVEREHGALDVLVNNAFTIHPDLSRKGPFWEKSLALQDMFDVGLRSAYVASYYAAPLLIRNGGLIVNTSSFGGRCYMHGPAYGAGKAAVDKMAHDMAVDFRPYNVAVVSIWMGLLKTERTEALFKGAPDRYASFAANAESPEFTGRLIDALARDPNLMDRSGQVLIGAELGEELGVLDIDGTRPHSHRETLGPPPTYNKAIVQ